MQNSISFKTRLEKLGFNIPPGVEDVVDVDFGPSCLKKINYLEQMRTIPPIPTHLNSLKNCPITIGQPTFSGSQNKEMYLNW